jgi:nicotinate-nucleotide pyrophosphorylase (carboxylating)
MHDALKAAGYGAGIIMLDNMAPDEIRKTTAALSRKGLRDKITIEISGGITGPSLAEYAGLDIDRISMGSLTHSVKNFSVNLEIVPSESE